MPGLSRLTHPGLGSQTQVPLECRRFQRLSLLSRTLLAVLCRDRVHMKGEQPVLPKSGGKPKDLSKKAVLLSGPPGVGKTSAALIVSRCILQCTGVAVSP